MSIETSHNQPDDSARLKLAFDKILDEAFAGLHHEQPKPYTRATKVLDGTGMDTGAAPDLEDRIINSICSHEGGFTAINKNDAGHGISVGIRQWNQGGGELPNLLRAWHDKCPGKFQKIFGQYSHALLNEQWVRNYDMAHDDTFMSAMQNALQDKDLQNVQYQEARKFVDRNVQLAHNYGFQSELGLALVCDMVNQLGPSGAEHALKRSGLTKGGALDDEDAVAQRVSKHRPNGKYFQNILAQRFSGAVPAMTLA